MKYDYTYISLGAGVQSSFMAVCCALGLYGVPRADFAIFADTQDEPREVYEHLWRLAAWLDTHGLRVEICSRGRLSDNPVDRFIRIPAWTNMDGSASPIKRQCTSNYKIQPIERRVRELIGVERGRRVKAKVRALHGISFDEVYRMKPSRTPWITVEFPLVDARLTRWHCLELWSKYCDLPAPPRSACVYCPYHSDDEWRRIRDNDPEAWEFACEYDERIRNSTRSGIRNPAYLHRSLVPLRDVDLTDYQANQANLWNAECEGMCGV